MASGSVIIEADDRVFHLSDNAWHTLLQGEAISVRSFPRSKRFQNIVSITCEEGIHLISAVDETKMGVG
jgi:hypothetical protein